MKTVHMEIETYIMHSSRATKIRPRGEVIHHRAVGYFHYIQCFFVVKTLTEKLIQ